MQIDHYQRLRERDAIMRAPNTADNVDVRKALLARVKSGEITLALASRNRRRNRKTREGRWFDRPRIPSSSRWCPERSSVATASARL